MKNIIKAISNEQKERLTTFIAEVNEIQSIEDLNVWRFNDLLPKGKKMTGFASIEQARQYLIERKQKAVYKEIERTTAKILDIANSGTLHSVKISVEWKRSRMWGSNPTAECWATFVNKDGDMDSVYIKTGSIGGCGYDKLSTAVAQALNEVKPVLKALYRVKNNNVAAKNHDIFGYGSGYGILPSIEGGVGISCYPAIFEKLGYEFKTVASGKTYDVFEITK